MQLFLSIVVFVLIFASVSTPGWATLTINSVSGASVYDSEKKVVYGGTAGDACADTSALCNNCLYAGVACNSRRINDALSLTFSIVSDTYGGKAVIADTTSKIAIGNAVSSSNYAKGTVATVSISWDDLCYQFNGGSSSCDDTGFSGKVLVGISSNENKDSAEDDDLADSHDESVDVTIAVHGNSFGGGMGDVHSSCEAPQDDEDAICFIEMSRGDEKAYIQSIQHVPSSSFPNSLNSYVYKKIRVMYAQSPSSTDCTQVADEAFQVEGSNKADLDISAESSTSVILEKDYVDGLSNGVPYCFKIGVVDSGENIGWFSPDPVGPVVPEAVYGLLTEDMNCFIATATYGSPWAPEVAVFRKFRDQILLQSRLGRAFVRIYYRWSPPVALLIRNQPMLRKISEIFLWPFWTFAKVAISFNLFSALLMSGVLFLFFLLAGSFFARNRRVQRMKV